MCNMYHNNGKLCYHMIFLAPADDDSDDDSGSPGAPTVNTKSMPAVDILSES